MKKKKDEEKQRRQRGSGSIFRKPPCNKWVIQFYKNGRRIREATGSVDYDSAKKLLRQRLHEIDKNEYLARHGKPARISDLYDALVEHNRINGKGRARELPGRWLHLGPVFGAIVAAELTTDEIRHYIRKRQDHRAANATINRELATLKRMFHFGTECTPPKVRVVPHIPMLKESNVRRGFVEDAEFSRLTVEASELWLRTFLELGFTYGWRYSELLGLRVRQVNVKDRTIRLDVGTTKNGEGREVTMTAKVVDLLREATLEKKPDDFVLTRRGRPIRDFRRTWRNLCIRAGLGSFVCCDCGLTAKDVKAKKCECGSEKRKYRGLIPHDLRRSAAKAARRAGVPESVVMAMGGWKTAAMFRRYAIVSSADQRAAVEALERARAEQRASVPAPFSAPSSEEAPEKSDEKLQ